MIKISQWLDKGSKCFLSKEDLEDSQWLVAIIATKKQGYQYLGKRKGLQYDH